MNGTQSETMRSKPDVRLAGDALIVRRVQLPPGDRPDMDTFPANVSSDYGLFGEWDVSVSQGSKPMQKPALDGSVTWQQKLPTHERLSRLLIGSSILTGLSLGFLVTPWAYLILVGLAVNLIQFSFTGRCKVKDLLDRFGVEYEPPPPQLTRSRTGER
ncbi:MAG: hypothetical protein C0404_06850 [Verrucomicrobia bacterium]|nr:hypothetical protein [Verrucomicrobiota bacterium]